MRKQGAQPAGVALLIVDVQQGFINAATVHVPPRVEALQQMYQTVLVTRFYNPVDSSFRRLLGWQRLARDSAEFELAFAPIAQAVVIDKTSYTCVNATLLERLEKSGIKMVHLCGIDTDICVTKCAVDLFESGLTPLVLQDFCASHAGEEAHQRGLQTLRRFIGKAQVV